MSLGVVEDEEEILDDDQPTLPADDGDDILGLVTRLATEGTGSEDDELPESKPTEGAPGAETPPAQGERARDAQGRFVKQDSEPGKPAKEAGQQPNNGVTEAPKPSEAEAPIPAPVSWKPEEKQAFARLPRELQQTVASRELQRDAFLLDTRRKWAAVQELITPYEQAWAERGISFPQVLNQFFAYSKSLNENPIRTGLRLMEERGVTREQLLHALTQGQNGSQQNGQPNGNGHSYDPRFDQLLGKVSSLEQQLTGQQRAELEERNTRVANEIYSFYQHSKDEAGNLKYPFYAEAMPLMDAISKQLRAANPGMKMEAFLDLVYQKAMAGDPRVLAHQKHLETQRTIADAGKRVEQSKKMTSLTGAPGGRMAKQYADDDIEGLVRAIAHGEI